MTRSNISTYSPKVAKKTFRSAAKEAGMQYEDAIQAQKEAQAEAGAKTLSTKIGVVRRNPGRMDGVRWNGGSFVCPTRVNGDDEFWEDEEYYRIMYDDYWTFEYPAEEEEGTAVRETQEVSLMDIAKPMKVKGIAREFEIVPTVQRVIPLEDDAKSENWEVMSCADSEWEEMYEDGSRSDSNSGNSARGAYSDALRTKGGGDR
ncbi:hypothetical protein V5O48_012372 [Marasmius crinis-equi]|uniref:Uncharacterized protein n=1 Tax=Marasmius crinis-equi TaxID=585013 RepID=A0ABR3F2Y9_9AGAR